MTSKELLTTLIENFNRNPLNENKFYFTNKGWATESGNHLFTEIGSNENNGKIFKDYFIAGAPKEMQEEQHYASVIETILVNLLCRMDAGEFRSSIILYGEKLNKTK
jgi:hypothetical protein